jgi:hypothetical protein
MELLQEIGRRLHRCAQIFTDKEISVHQRHRRPSASTLTLAHDERGQSLVVMLLLLVPLLVLVIGLVHDLGNVAAAQTIAQDAADLAAQDAAKQIDVAHYATTQEVILSPDALFVAGWWVDYVTGGRMRVTDLYATMDGEIVLEGEVTVSTGFLSLVGIPVVHRRVVAIARPRFGAQEESD